MEDRTVLSETWHDAGFLLRVEQVETPGYHVQTIHGDDDELTNELQEALDSSPPTMKMESAYNLAGDYIGSVEIAKFLCGDKGIKPEPISPESQVCSIGFCEDEQKWYGWSHRAIFGFGIGSVVAKGDCGYVPVDWDDFLEDAARFWNDENHDDVTARKSVDADGGEIALVEWIYDNDTPNKALRGTRGSATMYPPDRWGRGEWTAETLEDAKQMAADFAEGVS